MLEVSGEDLPSRGSLGVGCWAYPLPLASLWNVGFWWLDCFDDGWLNSEIRISTLNETHLTSYHVLQATRVSEFFQFLWCFVRIHGRFFYCIGCCTLIGIIIIENGKTSPTSSVGPLRKAGKDVTYIETKFMNFDLTALAMLYHYRNHQFLELTWRSKSVCLETIGWIQVKPGFNSPITV